MPRKKITILDIQKKRDRREPIVMITAYDYPSGILAENAEVDLILIGDSLGMVVHGFESTVPVTMEMMVLHCAAVARAKGNAFLIGDMPFGSYEVSVGEGVRNAFRLMKEGGVDAIKLEGGAERANVIRAISDAGIAVQGHIGLTPQSASKLGGFKLQGKTAASARDLLNDALALQAAGCFSIVLEAVPDRVATYITEQLTIPTIGIGAGAGCSGQVLVWHDMLGLFARFQPKFSKQFADIGSAITTALQTYTAEVRAGKFPAEEHVFSISDEEWNRFSQQ
jgi:3-methyl-2-oxobutanoate hydroxymethyltransferase